MIKGYEMGVVDVIGHMILGFHEPPTAPAHGQDKLLCTSGVKSLMAMVHQILY